METNVTIIAVASIGFIGNVIVAWITARNGKTVVAKVEAVHTIVNAQRDAMLKEIKELKAEIVALKN